MKDNHLLGSGNVDKTQSTMYGSVTDVQYDAGKWNPTQLVDKYVTKLEDYFLKQGYILVVLGFLLGRALILSQLAPFSHHSFAAVYM